MTKTMTLMTMTMTMQAPLLVAIAGVTHHEEHEAKRHNEDEAPAEDAPAGHRASN